MRHSLGEHGRLQWLLNQPVQALGPVVGVPHWPNTVPHRLQPEANRINKAQLVRYLLYPTTVFAMHTGHSTSLALSDREPPAVAARGQHSHVTGRVAVGQALVIQLICQSDDSSGLQ